MHRDAKVGLALGILLLGVVTALFFRNESSDGPEPPKLSDPDEIEQEIAEKPLLPYPTGIESIDEQSKESDPSESGEGLGRLFPGENGQAALRQWPGAAGPPDPIPQTAGPPDSEPVPRYNAAWSVVPADTNDADQLEAKPVSTSRETSGSSGSRRVHRVQEGDTLSELAAHYLGQSSRFLEIFEANRDVLTSPDNLPVGTVLRIPAPAPANDGKAAADNAGNDSPTGKAGRQEDQRDQAGQKPAGTHRGGPIEQEAAQSTGAPARRFVPVNRLLLMPWRNRRGIEPVPKETDSRVSK